MRSPTLIDVPVELTPFLPQVPDPIVDRPLPGGRAHLSAVRDRAILQIHGVGSFLVAGGRRISFAPQSGGSLERAAPWLHSTVATLLLAQRSQFALHASVVEVDGAAVAVCGPRGVGKSTTVLRLAQRGHRLVTDDVSVVTLGDEVMVHPLSHPIRVFPASAERLGLDTSDAWTVARQPKLALPAPSGPPLPLAAIAVLGRADGDDVTSAALTGADACWAVVRNTHRGGLYRALWEAEMFAWAGQVTATVAVHAVTRPHERWTVDEVGDAVTVAGAAAA